MGWITYVRMQSVHLVCSSRCPETWIWIWILIPVSSGIGPELVVSWELKVHSGVFCDMFVIVKSPFLQGSSADNPARRWCSFRWNTTENYLRGHLVYRSSKLFLSVEAYFLNQIWKKIASCKTDSGELSYMERDRETRRPVLIANLPPPTPWGFPEQGLKNMRLLTILSRTW